MQEICNGKVTGIKINPTEIPRRVPVTYPVEGQSGHVYDNYFNGDHDALRGYAILREPGTKPSVK